MQTLVPVLLGRRQLLNPLSGNINCIAYTIGNHDEGRFKNEVITQGLFKNTLVKRNVGCFALHNKQGLHRAAVNHNIKALFKVVELKFFFNRDRGRRVVFYRNKVIEHMLPHPFLGS